MDTVGQPNHGDPGPNALSNGSIYDIGDGRLVEVPEASEAGLAA